MGEGERELLWSGYYEDVDLSAVMGTLRLESPGARKPSKEALASAFASFERLVDRGLMKVGRLSLGQAVRSGGRPGAAIHVEESIDAASRRVEQECAKAQSFDDWRFACVLATTDLGDAVGRATLRDPEAPSLPRQGAMKVAALRNHLRDTALVVALDPARQLAWCEEHRLPIDEIAQSYTGMLRAWRDRLAYDGLVDDPQVERNSRGLGRHLIAMHALGEHRLWQGLSATEWMVAREIAKDLLRRVDDVSAPGEFDQI